MFRNYLKNKRADQAHMLNRLIDENCELRGRNSHLEVAIKLLRDKLKKEEEPESMYCEVA